jgi:magnesium transporter
MSTDGSARRRESAEYHLVKNVPTAHPDATCGEILALLRQRRFDYSDIIVITDDDRRVIGMLSVGALASRAAAVPVREAMQRNIAVAELDMDQEHVASLAIESNLGTVPVTDSAGRFVGLVPPAALLAVLRREHVEDLHRLAGILRENEAARAAIEGPPARRARHRLPWLLVGLVGSAVAAIVVAHFEEILEAHLAVVFFLPGIVYLADAISTQTEAIAVRGLSISNVGIGHLLVGELCTGLLIGSTLGGMVALVLWAILQDGLLALAVGIALFAAGAIATAIGLLLPWAFQRTGFDPAYGSGPLATVTQDVLSLLVYFGCVSLFLPLP